MIKSKFWARASFLEAVQFSIYIGIPIFVTVVATNPKNMKVMSDELLNKRIHATRTLLKLHTYYMLTPFMQLCS